MRAEIIISHGHVKLAHPVYLKPDAPTHYLLTIPDESVAENRDILLEESQQTFTTQLPPSKPGSLQEQYNQILGKMAKTRQAASIGDDYQALQDALEERYNGR